MGVAPDLAIHSYPIDGEWPRTDWGKDFVTTG